jgi:hypothetical protein
VKKSNGLWALLLVGGFYVYQNRFKIMQFLESEGVKLPKDADELKSSIQSGVTKIKGKAQDLGKEFGKNLDSQTDKAI